MKFPLEYPNACQICTCQIPLLDNHDSLHYFVPCFIPPFTKTTFHIYFQESEFYPSNMVGPSSSTNTPIDIDLSRSRESCCILPTRVCNIYRLGWRPWGRRIRIVIAARWCSLISTGWWQVNTAINLHRSLSSIVRNGLQRHLHVFWSIWIRGWTIY